MTHPAPNLFIEVVKTHPDAKLPEYKTDGASGMDLYALEDQELPGIVYGPFASKLLVPTGIAFSIPQGWEGQIRPRSSLSKMRIHVCLGTIDSDFRGPVSVCMFNLGPIPYTVHKGDRIAQIVFAPVGRAALQVVKEFSTQTARGAQGFGSTGKRD